ncbi:L-seryl-tRNA(Sec) selenium transferase [Dethiothermospora halolimnae]|uniref:L-seryl-tRNA(Sec) selenium transferase n=1 Tax=Dethiothermospora halolimnae TaxID=3114390 RepID=UPI003CCB89A1
MNNKGNLFSKLPKVDEIISKPDIDNLIKKIPREIVIETIREEIEKLRNKIRKNEIDYDTLSEITDSISEIVIKESNKKMETKFKRVINATGVVIHTNLGRSLVSKDVMEHISEVVTNYSNLEFDLEAGSRGSRYSHLENIITRITGAEAALVVNNNAAAVMLVLGSLAKEKEVVVSRGELVEIGGSFRVPDVMEQSGAHLVDVGTTNKTHIWDYEKAIGEDTGAFLKVHTSNYRILGFTSSVDLDALVKLGQKHDIPVVEDLGSGVLIDLKKYGLEHEPTVQDSIEAGVDIVTFSGDKLLGGPQAGIIIGKKRYIDEMKRNPLTRAFRVDKFTIATLEATLREYLNEENAIKNIPTLNMITCPIEELSKKANKLKTLIDEKISNKIITRVVDDFSQVGGGSMPLERIPTKDVVIYSDNINITKLEERLRAYKVPIITRLYKEKMYMDVRTIEDMDISTIVDGIEFAVSDI